MLRILMISGLLLVGASAHAYYDVLDTGEIMPAGRYKLTPDMQFLSQNGNANVGANFDAGLNDDMGLRGQIGFGDTDFYLGGFFKYMPYPDVENQPAIGGNIGVIYAQDAGAADFTVRVEPLISKRFGGDWGGITPYGSIPIGLRHRSAERYTGDDNSLTLQAVGGLQLDLKTVPDFAFFTEIGVDINETTDYVSFAFAWYFGNNNQLGQD